MSTQSAAAWPILARMIDRLTRHRGRCTALALAAVVLLLGACEDWFPREDEPEREAPAKPKPEPEPDTVTTGPKIYWTSSAGAEIMRANLDGSGAEIIIEQTDGPDSLALDVARGKMYWISHVTGGDKFIRRANLDGSDIEDLVFFGYDEDHAPEDIALDVTGQKMYWTLDVGYFRRPDNQDRIQRANLDGSEVETVIIADAGSYFWDPSGIALDIAAGKMYWLDRGNEQIWRANLNGSGAEILVNLSVFYYLNHIYLDVTAGKMYFSSGGEEIYRGNLDGSGIENIVDLPSGYVRGLDATQGKIYWTDGFSKIQRANLDGSQIEDVVTGDTTDSSGSRLSIFTPRSIALDPRDR